jgi:dimethylglycine dehydrogenase
MSGDPILHQGRCAGYVTSGGTGFRCGRCIALGYVDAKVPAQAEEFEVTILGENRSARSSITAFYDPENLRVRQ